MKSDAFINRFAWQARIMSGGNDRHSWPRCRTGRSQFACKNFETPIQAKPSDQNQDPRLLPYAQRYFLGAISIFP
jgi:hypothetical protein